MGKFLNGHGSGPGPSPKARGLGPFKNLPMKELAHEQELAHSNLAGVGWGGWGGVGWGWGGGGES